MLFAGTATGAWGSLCYGSWQFIQSPAVTSATHAVGGWLGPLGVIWKAGTVLVSAAGHAVQSLSPATLVCGATMLILSYAMCVGLGTIYVRLAFARR